MPRTGRMLTSTEKSEIVRRHVKDKVPVSHLNGKLDVRPSQIHKWVEVVITQGVEMVLQKALEKTQEVKPRINSVKGPQFIDKECKIFLGVFGWNHVKPSPYDPQSNGKLKRWHGAQTMLQGHAKEISKARDQSLKATREARRDKRDEANKAVESLAS